MNSVLKNVAASVLVLGCRAVSLPKPAVTLEREALAVVLAQPVVLGVGRLAAEGGAEALTVPA